MMDAERVAFLLLKNKCFPNKDGINVVKMSVAVDAARTAYNQGLEDAAKVADKCELGNGDIADEIAAAIREKIKETK